MFENESLLQSTSEKISKLWYHVVVFPECENTKIPQYLDTTVIRLLPLSWKKISTLVLRTNKPVCNLNFPLKNLVFYVRTSNETERNLHE